MHVAWGMAVTQSGAETDNIVALGFSHQRCTFAIANQDGQPRTNFIVWMERRGIPYLSRVHQEFGRMEYYNRIGLPIYYISSLSKILWFADNLPDVFEKDAIIWPISNFIFAALESKILRSIMLPPRSMG